MIESNVMNPMREVEKLAKPRSQENHGRESLADGPGRLLLINGLERSGTTLLMQVLQRHPQTVIPNAHPFENLMCQQWEAMAQVLMGDHEHEEKPMLGSITGPSPYYYRLTEPGVDMQPTAEQYQRETIAYCRRQALAFYDHVPQARSDHVIVEKRLGRMARVPMIHLFPDHHMCHVVRDLRDVIASIVRFDAQRGYYGFGRKPEEPLFTYVTRYCERRIAPFVASIEAASENTPIVKFDEVVSGAAEPMVRMLSKAGLATDEKILDQMRAARYANPEQAEAHKTSSISKDRRAAWEDAFGDDHDAIEGLLDPYNRSLGFGVG